MNWVIAFLSRIVNAPQWRDIATAPFDRAIELAIIDGDIGVLGYPCLRRGDAWFDAETIGLMGFLWSLKSGQYDDLDGAAWRAIADDEPAGSSNGE